MVNKFIFCLMALFLSSCAIQNPKDGKKIGRIVKLASEGLICKTCEGELLRGGLIDGSGSMGNSFHFTISDSNLISIANSALEDQSEVIIYYITPFFVWASETEHMNDPHFVYRIEIK